MRLRDIQGEDRGAVPLGLVANFAIGTLELAAGTVVEVVDAFDNQQDGLAKCDEVLYVDALVLNPGAELNTALRAIGRSARIAGPTHPSPESTPKGYG